MLILHVMIAHLYVTKKYLKLVFVQFHSNFFENSTTEKSVGGSLLTLMHFHLLKKQFNAKIRIKTEETFKRASLLLTAL